MRNFAYWYVNSIYTHDELLDIVQHIEKEYNPEFKDSPAENATKTATVKIINWDKIAHKLYVAYDYAKYTNMQEIGYDVYEMAGKQTLNLNTYSSENKAEYSWHIDATGDAAPTDMKLTALLNVSTEPYIGGEFQLFRNGAISVPELSTPGSMVVFPSFISHRVLPVTAGIRKTLAMWLIGPKFR